MPMTLLPGRGVVEVSGEDRATFLQGLVSNDVTGAAPGRAIWAALLTPQGKWTADFFIFTEDGRLLQDCVRQHAAQIRRGLSLLRLRAKVSL
jgi:folate-binding Fe-S cluster repair protein YgfZ